MATTGAEVEQAGPDMKQDHPTLPLLSIVRRFEAASFRAWPAATTHYDGAWLLRFTAAHPARRLNSINPLDPGDDHNIAERIGRAERQFHGYGRPVTFRLSPLAGPNLCDYLDNAGWAAASETLVMLAELDNIDFDSAIDQIPLKHIGRFVDAALDVGVLDPAVRAGLSEVIGGIKAETGLFVHEVDEKPVATTICVHDHDLAGLFEVATSESLRRQGLARAIVVTALKWARLRGARRAWLQVEADNEAAISLYRRLGFGELYRYHYRQQPAG